MGKISQYAPLPVGTRVVATARIAYAAAGVHIEAGTRGTVVPLAAGLPRYGIARIVWEGAGERPLLTKTFEQVAVEGHHGR